MQEASAYSADLTTVRDRPCMSVCEWLFSSMGWEGEASGSLVVGEAV